MRDPKPERLSLPLFAVIVGIPLAIVVILQLLGVIPRRSGSERVPR